MDISSTHATVDNSNNNNEEEEEQVNRKEYKEFEKDTYASTNADDHLADLNGFMSTTAKHSSSSFSHTLSISVNLFHFNTIP